jgi:hypothetical protein
VGRKLTIEIRGKDEFWSRAFHVEWEDQFGERVLDGDSEGRFSVDADWLDDLHKVAGQTFCRIVVAPESPGRRRWFNQIVRRP